MGLFYHCSQVERALGSVAVEYLMLYHYFMAKDNRTYADRREYIIQAVIKRRRKIKTKAIEYMGGKCQICGYSRFQGALDFHHVNPATKILQSPATAILDPGNV